MTFSINNSNNDSMLETNKGLYRAIKAYNEKFNTSFGMDDISGYTQDVISRLNKTAKDGNFLDLVIVVDQLLTGFDAQELNTLYVDRTLKGANLIQAYSRTNRIADMQEKPWGRIVNYRWPAQNEKLMNEALAVYANKDSAKLSDEERRRQNVKDGITAPQFNDVLVEVRDTVQKMSSLTNGFVQLPPSEKQKDYMVDLTESLQMSAQDDKESLDIINTLQTIINKNEVFKEMDFLTKFIAHIHINNPLNFTKGRSLGIRGGYAGIGLKMIQEERV